MAAFLLTLGAMYTLVREMWRLFNQPHYRALSIWFTILLGIGTTFYHVDEGWSWLDSLYFCVITLATVGYGDLAPTTPEAKVFTIIYIFLGISIFVTIVSLLVKERQLIYSERTKKSADDADSAQS